MSAVTYTIPPQQFILLNSPMMERPAVMWSGPGGELATSDITTYELFDLDHRIELYEAAIAIGVPAEEILQILEMAMKELEDV